MTLRKSRVVIYFEFFKPQDIEKLEDIIRKLVKNKQFPSFSTITPMVDYLGLKQVGEEIMREREYPLVIGGKDFSRGKYGRIVRDAKKV